jgi:multidrug transporter EmrE-like cation transporter
MLKVYIVFLFAVFVAATAQAILKYAAMQHYDCWWKAYLNLYVIGAYGLFFLSTLLAVWAYRVLPLSMGVMLDATGYFYVVLFGRMFFGERLTMRKMMGLGLIAGGICVYAVAG